MENNDEALRLNLDLLDEKREQVLRRTEDYQRKTARLQPKQAPASKEESNTWETGPQLGRPLHHISSRQTRQLRAPNGGRENLTACLECGTS